MPERFQPEQLAAGLRPLQLGAEQHSGAAYLEQEQAYRRLYGLDRLPAEQTRLGYFEAAGFRIATQLWWPRQPKATLLLVHGYYDHMGLYRHVIEWALGMGFVVLALDLPGHGLSSGPRASIDDFADYQQVLLGALAQAEALELPKPWHLFGQSTGAAIIIDYLLNGQPGPEIDQTLLLAPLVRPRAWGWSKLSYRLLKPFVTQIPRTFSNNSHDPLFIDFVHHHDPLQPRHLPTAWVGALSRWVTQIEAAPPCPRSLVMVQGEQDQTVDWRHNLAVLADKFAAPQVLRLAQGRHHLANESQALRSHIFAFLTEHLSAP